MLALAKFDPSATLKEIAGEWMLKVELVKCKFSKLTSQLVLLMSSKLSLDIRSLEVEKIELNENHDARLLEIYGNSFCILKANNSTHIDPT
jgi:hypothetical protein